MPESPRTVGSARPPRPLPDGGRAFLTVLLLSLSGCALFHTEAPVAALRERILPPPETSKSSPDPLETGDAETLLPCVSAATSEPLTLVQAVDLGLRLNPRLELMRARITRANANEQIAFADYLPEARLSLRHLEGTPRSEPFALPTMPTDVGNIAPLGPSDRFDRAELAVQWTMWDFGRRAGRFGQAVSATEIARLQYERARQTTTFTITTAYLAVLQARATHRVADEAVRRAESVLRDARNFLQRGLAIRNDVLRTEVLLLEMRLAQVKARTAELAAIAGLNQAIGINVSAPTRIVDLAEEPPFDQSLGQALERAAAQRDEFGVVLRTIRSARLGTGVRQADFMPRIVAGGVGMQEETAGGPNRSLASGGVGLELALFEGGRRVGKLRGAEAEVREAIAAGKEICDRIAYEVNIAWLGIDDARQRLALSRTAVEQATENLRVVRRLFDQGDSTPTDLVDAELAFIRAQQNQYTALYDYQTALARLAYAVGDPAPGGGSHHE